MTRNTSIEISRWDLLDPEVAQYRRARLRRVVVEKNVVAMSPQAWLEANELSDLAQGRAPTPSQPRPARPRAAPRPTCGAEQSVS